VESWTVVGPDGRVMVPAVCGRRRCPEVACHSCIVAQLEGAGGKLVPLLVARVAGEFGDVPGDVDHRPVPEAARGRRVGVVARHREAASGVRERAPRQLR